MLFNTFEKFYTFLPPKSPTFVKTAAKKRPFYLATPKLDEAINKNENPLHNLVEMSLNVNHTVASVELWWMN